MIIKTENMAVNLDYVTTIEIEKESNTLGKLFDMEEEPTKYGICFNQIDEHGVMLQSYTQERAKEIYEDIISKWANKICAVYTMPKE